MYKHNTKAKQSQYRDRTPRPHLMTNYSIPTQHLQKHVSFNDHHRPSMVASFQIIQIDVATPMQMLAFAFLLHLHVVSWASLPPLRCIYNMPGWIGHQQDMRKREYNGMYIYIYLYDSANHQKIYISIYIYSHDTLISAAVCYLAKHAHIGPGFGNKVCLLKHDLLQCGTAYAQICASHVLVRCSFFFCSSSKRLFFSFQCQATSFRNNHLWTPSPHSHSPCLQHTNQPPLFKVFHHVLLKATTHSDGCRTHASTPPEILPVQNCVHLRHFQLPTYVCSFLSIMCLWGWQCARAFSWNLPQNQETFQ